MNDTKAPPRSDAKAEKKTRTRKDPVEAAAKKVAAFDLDQLKRFVGHLATSNPTNAKLIKGERVELALG